MLLNDCRMVRWLHQFGFQFINCCIISLYCTENGNTLKSSERQRSTTATTVMKVTHKLGIKMAPEQWHGIL